MRKPTINDVAAAAGVSRATASRALSDYGRISAGTVQAVKAAAEAIGYTPNQVARSMRAGSTKTIGLVIIADFTNVFFDRATKGIVDAARASGYEVLICEKAVQEAKAKNHKNMAFLIATSTVQSPQTEKPILQNSTIEDRVNGFMNGVIDNKVKNAQWVYSPDEPQQAEDAVAKLLTGKNPPTIIFTSNNDMALAVMRTVNRLKLNIPNDVSLVTVDDSQWLDAIAPGITVVERPVDELARLAVKKLIEHINNKTKKPEKIVLPTNLISRGSIKTLKAK